MDRRVRRVLIVFPDDGYANTSRARALGQFLGKNGHETVVRDTYYLSRLCGKRGSIGSKLPAFDPLRAALYAVDAASLLVLRSRVTRRHLTYYVRLADCTLRRAILSRSLHLDEFDLVICTTPHDAWVLPTARVARTLYDCPTPWAAELHDDGKLTDRQFEKLKAREKELFEQVDHLAFNWQSYGEYAVERYGITGRNLLTLNTGCTPVERRAAFSSPPRIVYVGSLAGRAIDLPLLGRLSKLYPHIDVYGGPPPDPALGLNYRGYATSTDVMRDYQLGLVTSSRDELRRYGFSAKHPEYLSYGLPVLAPAWRRNLHLLKGSVPYDEATFTAAVERLSDADVWRRTSDEAYAQAQRLSWDETLRPLEAIVRGETDGGGRRFETERAT
jgi:hypothetical protein